MPDKTSIVVTSIAAPNNVLKELAAGARERGVRFYVIGDVPSPADFFLEGCDFYSLERQAKTNLRFAASCPKRHYARKNIGYLLAIQDGADIIVETDDDNYPLASFWSKRSRARRAPALSETGWVNVYGYFSEVNIWPRGLPLDAIHNSVPALGAPQHVDTPIQQGLADDNPDVDAIYRLVLPLPLKFKQGVEVALGKDAWCPFNSQNTSWWPDAYPLLYLPAYCSFRMTDIWRSFVAQRIAWENGWHILFQSSSVYQERNDHSLIRDFKDEIPGYLHNRVMCEKLGALTLKPGVAEIEDNLRLCYECLVENRWVGQEELSLLDAWLSDLRAVRTSEPNVLAARA